MAPLVRSLLLPGTMRSSVRSLLVVLMSVSACARAGEPHPSSAIPTVEPSDDAAAVSPAEPTLGSLSTLRPNPELPEISPMPAPEPRVVAETVKLEGQGTVRAEPRIDAPVLGQVALGARVDVYERVEGSGCARKWLAIAPRGFVCAPSERTTRAATPMLPELPGGAQIPGVYGSVGKGAKVYDSLASFDAGLGRVPESHLTVRRERVITRGEHTLWKTRYGLVDERDVRRFRPSGFHGELLTDGLEQPLAFTLPASQKHHVEVRAEPSDRAEVVATLGARLPRPVLEERDGFVRVEEGWIDRGRVRLAHRAEAPTELREGERWLDVDLSEQVLVAYEGAEPVYATLISSGRPGHRTPTGIYRIDKKVAERTMNSMADSSDSYSVDRVPWTAYFAHGYALHAAFWHGGFGRTRSHGCVNLSPTDARVLYDWMAPLSAPGWSEVYGHEDQPGSLVRVHDRRDPEPKWRGYAKQMHEAATVGEGTRLAAAPATTRAG